MSEAISFPWPATCPLSPDHPAPGEKARRQPCEVLRGAIESRGEAFGGKQPEGRRGGLGGPPPRAAPELLAVVPVLVDESVAFLVGLGEFSLRGLSASQCRVSLSSHLGELSGQFRNSGLLT